MSEENTPIEKQEWQARSTRLPTVGIKFLLVSLLLALVKLWLISRDEIVARQTGVDDLWYLHSAKEWYWFGPYSDQPFGTPPFVRLPAYPLFVALTKVTGVPLRISTEVLLVVAALVFVVAIVKTGQSRVLAILLYAAIIFHPASYQVNNVATYNSFYASILLFALASMIVLQSKRDDIHRLRYALLTGTVLAVLWHIRTESIIILGLLGLYGLIAVLPAVIKRKSWLPIFRQLGVLVLVPALVILIASLTIKTINYFKFGLFAADAMSAPGFEAASKALLRIKPMPPVRRVAVPREVRHRAYLVSPAFRELEPYLEGPAGEDWAKFAKASGVTLENEISTSHFFWALNIGAYHIGYNRSARQADRYFQRVANEINAACGDGRLQCRWAFSPVIDPHFQNYLPYLPGSFRRMYGLFFETQSPARWRDSPDLSPAVVQIFDEMANRRTTMNTSDSMTYLSGWAADPNDGLKRVFIRDQSSSVLASTDQIRPRPDVVSGYAAQNIKMPLNSGYYFGFPSTSAVEIVFITQSGKEFVVPRPEKLPVYDTKGSLTYAVDFGMTVEQSPDLQLPVQTFIGANYGRLTVLLTYLSLGSLFVLLIGYKYIKPNGNVYRIIALLAVTIVIRVALFALIDASSYAAAIATYLYPVMYLYTCFLLLIIGQAISVIVSVLKHYKTLRKSRWSKIGTRDSI